MFLIFSNLELKQCLSEEVFSHPFKASTHNEVDIAHWHIRDNANWWNKEKS